MSETLKHYNGDVPLKTEEKPEANKTFFTTIYDKSTTQTITTKPKWFEFWKKPTTREIVVAGLPLYNFLYPNTSFEVKVYDDETVELKVLGSKFAIKDEDVGREDVLVIIDVTNDPFIVRAGQVISLNYHTLRFEMSFAKIINHNTFSCLRNDFKLKIGIPQI